MTMTLDRRTLLYGLAATAPLAASACSPISNLIHGDLAWTDATGTAELIRKRQISAREVVQGAIDRANAVNPKLNFLVTADFERALKRAGGELAGPFAGVPTLIKDLYDLEGLPTKNGARALAHAPPVKASEPVVAAFLAAGFIPIGKSSTPEFGSLPTTEPLAGGPTRNPWDLTRSSGGSSGGSAAAVAAGVVPVAQASDGGGSIRIPASCCGLFGLKPSRGRMIGSTDSLKELSVKNCEARTVRDAAGVFAALEKTGDGATLPAVGLVKGPNTRRLKIGWIAADPNGRPADKPVADATQKAADLCKRLGHTVEPMVWPTLSKDFTQAFLVLWAARSPEIVQGVAKALGRAPGPQDLEPFTLGMARASAALPAGAVDRAMATVATGAKGYLSLFERYDVVLTPVLSSAPPKLGWTRGDVPYDTLIERLIEYVGYTPIVNVAGNTAMSVPLSWTDAGLPVGAHFAAAPGQERTLFELAFELERAQPWADKKPPVHA
ncbi:MAG TPA: amidase [Caulobacteraceae bacterium]|jgi:amidase|nr:amidase [Caulobacteraceae bacterium]